MTSLSKKGSRVKGNRFELDVAKELSEGLDIPCERVLLSGIRGEGDVSIVGLPLHVECKRCETLKISQWFKEEQHKALDKPFVLVYRKSREPARVVMDLNDFISIVRLAQGKLP